MNFEYLMGFEGFTFYQLQTDDCYELWICNKERSMMGMVMGRYIEFEPADVTAWWDAGYFKGWTSCESFTDPEL